MVEDFAEWRIRQHSWAVTVDRSGFGVLYGGFHLGDGDEDGTDSDGEYAYESLPSSPVDSDSETTGDEAPGAREGGLGYDRDVDDGGMGWNSDARWHVANQEEDAGSDSDSDMARPWIKLADAAPPLPSTVTFVDDILDSTRGQYDRETVLERFSQSQVGDFLLE